MPSWLEIRQLSKLFDENIERNVKTSVVTFHFFCHHLYFLPFCMSESNAYFINNSRGKHKKGSLKLRGKSIIVTWQEINCQERTPSFFCLPFLKHNDLCEACFVNYNKRKKIQNDFQIKGKISKNVFFQFIRFVLSNPLLFYLFWRKCDLTLHWRIQVQEQFEATQQLLLKPELCWAPHHVVSKKIDVEYLGGNQPFLHSSTLWKMALF